MERTRWWAGGLAALVLVGAPGAAWAGIVVLKSGRTFVGRLDPQEVTSETLTLRWPYGERKDEGSWTFQRHEVRWFDAEADAPTDAYWADHLDDPIEPRWHSARAEYVRRTQEPPPPPIEVILPGLLETRPLRDPHFTIRKPTGWHVVVEEGITMIVAPEEASGFTPRIHVFSVATPRAALDTQMAWIQEELARLAERDGFRVVEAYRRRDAPGGGADQRLETLTVTADRRVAALREVRFRSKRTVLFAAYAAEADYPELESLFATCLQSLELSEDRRQP